MHLDTVLILPSLALAFTVTQNTTCTYGADPCPFGSSCSPTQVCGGLCYTPESLPPAVPCTVGDNGPCATHSTCTPTTYCTTPTPCGGQCINTSGFQNPNNQSLPSIPCVLNGSLCPTDAYCRLTQVCEGNCNIITPTMTATATPTPTPTQTPCGGTHGRQCEKKYKCIGPDGKHCGAKPDCHGFCEPKE